MSEEAAVQARPATLVEPDLDLIRDLKQAGGDTLKKCYQCATCSVVCALSPQEKPFPRKEMIWAQWGLKEKLVSDVDIWLCHQCADCSNYCPRGAKPGQVLAALRNYCFGYYAVPKFAARLVKEGRFLPLLLALPAVLLLLVIGLYNGLGFPQADKVIFRNWVHPTFNVDVVFVPFAALAVVVLLRGLKLFVNNIHARALEAGWARHQTVGVGDIISNLIGVLADILPHRRFKECDANRPRYQAHLLVFYGFVTLFFVTGIVALFYYAEELHITAHNLLGNPIPVSNPVKWLANLGGLAILIGVSLMINNRLKQEDKFGRGGYPDWALLVMILAVVITGFLSELLRWANTSAAYLAYFVHLVCVFWLIAYLPFSKLAHFVYRAVAMAYARYQGREMMPKLVPAPAMAAAAPAAEAEPAAAEDDSEGKQAD